MCPVGAVSGDTKEFGQTSQKLYKQVLSSGITMKPCATDFLLNNESAYYYNSDIRNGTLSLHDLYKQSDKDTFLSYKPAATIIGILVVLCNVVVVVSSGLILRKGQQPKNTYILLGNVSLADTIVGLFLIYSALGGQTLPSSPLCVFKTGMLVCPAIVSIFSVALIAVDRYCYILHGLYYHRYFTTTRVRISIILTWILGITLAFLPGVGWINRNYHEDAPCSYLSLFPDYLILLNTFLSVIALMLIAVLYSIILMHALRNVKNIRASKITVNTKKSKSGETLDTVTIHRGHISECHKKIKDQSNNNNNSGLTRSASFSSSRDFKFVVWANLNAKSRSINDLIAEVPRYKRRTSVKEITQRRSTTESDYSITSIDLSSSCEQNVSSVDVSNKLRIQKVCKNIKDNIKNKRKEPSKLRAVIVVSLTSGSIIITWLPFFVTVILYVLCENKQCNFRCLRYKLLLGPFLTLAFLNSLLNPLIYAWWHKGFKRSVKNYYRRHICKRISTT